VPGFRPLTQRADRFSLAVGCVALLSPCAALLGPGVASASAGWSIQSTPNPAGATFTRLKGVSCWSSTACTAVGGYGTGSGPEKTLAERWNGTTWVIQRTPNPSRDSELSAVSCPSSRVCMAVGSTDSGARALAERWKANKWVVQRLPRLAAFGLLKGISCSSPKACTAVGFTEGGARTLAERWNGSRWVIQRTPKPTAGFASQLVPLNAASCSAKACTAVGNYDTGRSTQKTLAEGWNGTRWKIQPTPNTASSETALNGVSCRSGRCIAVGYHWITSRRVLAEGWNGSRWLVQSIARPGEAIASELNGVSCVSPTFCIAVGSYTTNRGVEKTLAERYST
jgi:hypothetical protein